MVVVSDDVAVGREQNKMVGRRGLAGTAIIHKILGAATNNRRDESLKTLSQLGHAVNKNLVTLGASLDRTSVPGSSEDDSDEVEFTGHNEAELGLGIHNEPGVKMSPIQILMNWLRKCFIKCYHQKIKTVIMLILI